MSMLRPPRLLSSRTVLSSLSCSLSLWLPLSLALGLSLAPSAPRDAAAGPEPSAWTLDRARGTLVNGDGNRDCGVVYMHADDVYYTGFAWSENGAQLPYYGAFAECYSVPGPICGIVLDLTQDGGQADHTVNIYVWADDDGVPGEILAVRNYVDPGPVAMWPEVSRHILSIPEVSPPGPYWVGFWGNWENATPGYYIGADGGSFENGCAMTNIEPSLGFPDGWNHVSVAFSPADALGIGVQIAVNEGIGACCLQNFDCVIETESNCASFGGTFQGSGAVCTPELCLPETGACCLGQTCFLITWEDCNQHDGIFLGTPACAPNPCAVSGVDDQESSPDPVPVSWGRLKNIAR